LLYWEAGAEELLYIYQPIFIIEIFFTPFPYEHDDLSIIANCDMGSAPMDPASYSVDM